MSRPLVQQFVGHYTRNLGLHVVRLNGKAPIDAQWNKGASPHVDDFHEDHNVGIRSINGITIIDDDFDTPEEGCADAFLPPTGAIYGRSAKPRSKRLYRTELTETVTFTDLDGSHLTQVRVKLQDMAPPSTYPNTQERLKWFTRAIEPREINGEQLVTLVRFYWTARLIAKYWPDHNRHDLRLAYARVLLDTLGLEREWACRVLEWACRVGGSDEKGVTDVRRVVADTHDKLQRDEHVIGAPTVVRLLPEGAALIALLRKAYEKQSPIDEAIDRLNERFAIISVGNRVVVMETEEDRKIKELWSFDEFHRLLIKEQVRIKKKRVQLSHVWIKHRRGLQYDRLVYGIPGSDVIVGPHDFDGWRGFTVKPASGEWSRNRDHLLNIICRGNQNDFDWVLNWLAALVQKPGRHAMTAIVLRGGQGTGKGHFADKMIGALFHRQQYLHITGAETLTGRFNEHLSGKCYTYADEATWGGSPAAADKLKGLITEDTVAIERKFLPLVEEPSALHIIIASNNDWPIMIPPDDRRFMVLDVKDTKRQDDAHFQPLREELSHGGLAAMLHDLLAHPVDEHALRHPLSTEGKREIATLSFKPIERWWFEKLVNGAMSVEIVTGDSKKNVTREIVYDWPEKVPKSSLHEDYMLFLDRYHRDGRTRRSTETELGVFLKKYTPIRVQGRLYDGGPRVWELPTLQACREAWLVANNWPIEYRWEDV